MRFRLIYSGELRANQRDPLNGQVDKLASHKHSIRQQFHHQLAQLWQKHPALKNNFVSASEYGLSDAEFDGSDKDENGRIQLASVVAKLYQNERFAFVPLIRNVWHLRCSLEIIFLRRDPPGAAISAGDIDNRVKTLLDGLRMPTGKQELVDKSPETSESPFFCLLEDDKLVTDISVQTDELFSSQVGNAERDSKESLCIVTVNIRPSSMTWFNTVFY